MIAASDLPNKLAAALVHVRETKQPAFVVQDGAPAGVLLDVEDYNRLVELAERGELQEAIARAAEADATGDIVDWDDVKRDLFGWLSEKQ